MPPGPISSPNHPNQSMESVSEEQVVVAFHFFLQDVLAQAHQEQLLDASILSSARTDVQIQGPALCLLLAALRSEGDPPRINTSHLSLNHDTCPPSFKNWFRLWSDCVPQVKALSDDQAHDLARIICDQEPQSQPILIELPIIAQNLRAIAIEISQRRVFQERFNQDLSQAIQRLSRPPQVPPNEPVHSALPSPPAYDTLVPQESHQEVHPTKIHFSHELANAPGHHLHTPSSGMIPTQSVPTDQDHWALSIIRETLYASLADVVYSSPRIRQILESPHSTYGELSRAYFAALCLAVLDVSLSMVNLDTCTVKVVNLGRGSPSSIGLSDCPPHVQPLFGQLLLVASATQALAQNDHQQAIQSAHSTDQPPGHKNCIGRHTSIECLKAELEQGTNWQSGPNSSDFSQSDWASSEKVRCAANRINAHALKVTQVNAFRKREEALFEVLVPGLIARQNRQSQH